MNNEFPEEMIVESDGKPLEIIYKMDRGMFCETPCPHGKTKDGSKIMVNSICCGKCGSHVSRTESTVKCSEGMTK